MRGDGRVYQRVGTTCWHIAYNHRGKEIRESSRSPNKKDAEKLLRRRLKEVGADSLGLKAFVGPQQDRVTVGELLDALAADFRVRGLKSLKQNLSHMRIAREAFGHLRAVNLTTEMVSRYIAERLAEGQAPATVNRRTGMLAAAELYAGDSEAARGQCEAGILCRQRLFRGSPPSRRSGRRRLPGVVLLDRNEAGRDTKPDLESF